MLRRHSSGASATCTNELLLYRGMHCPWSCTCTSLIGLSIGRASGAWAGAATYGIPTWHHWQGRGATSARQTGHELTAALLQEDGTLGAILGDAPALEALLDALCGVTGPKEQDSEARAALAESIKLLVSACELWHGALQHGCAFSCDAEAGPLTLAEHTEGHTLQAVDVTPVFFLTLTAQAQ